MQLYKKKPPQAFLPASSPSPSHSLHLILVQILRTRIPNPILIDRKQAIALRQARTIVNLTDARLAPALLQTQARGRGMGDDIASDGFLGIGIEHGAGPAIDLGDDLVGDDDGDAELVREALQRAHEPGQVRLAVRELAAAGEIGAVEGGGAVDDEEGKAGLAHHLAGLVQQLQLVVGIVGARVGHVVQHLFAVEPVAVGDGEAAHGPEGAFGVDVEAFAFAPAHVEGQLARHRERVADLRFARAEFPEDFRDGARFDAAGEQGVELFRPGRDGD